MMDWKKNGNCILIILIAVLSFLLRFCGLGTSVLISNEAELALDAQNLYSLKGACASGQLLYLLPTAWLIKLFGSTTVSVRLFPALMGFLLSLLPLCLRKKIGKRKSLLLFVCLSVDPVLLYWSKRADAVIPTITLLAAGFAFLLIGHQRSGTIFLALSVCGGERFWPFLISAGLGFLVFEVVEKYRNGSRCFLFGKLQKENWKLGLLVLLLFSTGLGTFPAGIGLLGTGLGNSLGFSSAWTRPGLAAMLIAPVKYCGIPLLLLVISSRMKRDYRLLGFYAGIFALLLCWQGVMGLPYLSFCLLAGWVVGLLPLMYIHVPLHPDFAFCFSMCAVPALFSFLWFRVVELVNQIRNQQSAVIHWNHSSYQLPISSFAASCILTLLCVLILGLIIKILLGFFGTITVKQGALLGFLLVIAGGWVQNCWTAAGFSRTGDFPAAAHQENSAVLLNGNYASLIDSALTEVLRETLIKRNEEDPCILSITLDDPLLRWELQEQGIPFIVQNAAMTDWEQTDILITSDPAASYENKGMVKTSLPYAERLRWNDLSFADWGKWVISEKAAAVSSSIHVWVKNSYIFMERSE